MKYHLVVAKKKTVYHFTFGTMTEAFRYYLKHYSTIDEWLYYLRVSHTLLSSIKNEEIMACCFRNAFNKRVTCFQSKD